MKQDYELSINEIYDRYPSGHPIFTVEKWRHAGAVSDYWIWGLKSLGAEEETFDHDFSWEQDP